MATTKGVATQGKWLDRTRRFFSGVWKELKKVHWPKRRELITYTVVVLVAVTIVGVIIWVLDNIFSRLLDLVI